MSSEDASAGEKRVKSFIVRLSHPPEGFSAEVRPLTGGKNRTFKALTQLFTFLEAEAMEESHTRSAKG